MAKDTIKLDKGIYRKKNGTSIYVLYRENYQGGFRTVEAARNYRDKAVEKKRAEDEEYPKLTLGDFCKNRFYNWHLAAQSDNTREAYRYVFKKILPILGHKKIASIRPDDIFRMIEQLKDEGVSTYYVNFCRRSLNVVFAKALKWQVPGVERNPVSVVDPLPYDAKERPYLRLDQYDIFDDAHIMDRTIIGFGLYEGARVSEIFGFKWEDIDFVHGIVSFERQFQDHKITKLKTKGSRAKIPLFKNQMFLLQEWKAFSSDPRKMQEVFPRYSEGNDGWIFPSAYKNNPNPYNGDHWELDRWLPLRRSLGLPDDFTVHCLKHSYTSVICNNPAFTIKQVQGFCRHTSIKTTMDVYAKVSHIDLQDIIERLPQGVFETRKLEKNPLQIEDDDEK